MNTPMKTNNSDSGEVYGAKFFTWAIIVVAAGLLVAMTSDFTAKQPSQTTAATTSAPTAVVETVTPRKPS